MTKPFNIHDWQAKQKKQRLTEKFDPSVPNSQDLTLAPEIKKYHHEICISGKKKCFHFYSVSYQE